MYDFNNCDLTSLEGSPEEVSGNFDARYNKRLDLVVEIGYVGGKVRYRDND